jgi:hypothetical protein
MELFVGTQLIGLACLLLGVGVFFGLWSMTIEKRTKEIEDFDEPLGKPESTSSRLGEAEFSLAPQAKVMATQPSAAVKATRVEALASKAGNGHAAEEQECSSARTHLEIANQFFGMGDFEGAAEMCHLVIDNPTASQIQISNAETIIVQCA